MMPSRNKQRKVDRKRNNTSKTSTYTRKRNWDLKKNTINIQSTDPNEMIYNYKSKQSWKVVPKDSIEVHKDRRKRQMHDKRRKEEQKYDKNDGDKGNDDRNHRNTSRRNSRKRKKYSPRHDRESSSSCSTSTTLSCCTSCDSCVRHMDCE